MIQRLFLIAVLLLPSTIASAHPGHGIDGGSNQIGHYLSDPLHLAGFLVLVTVLAISAALIKRSARAETR